MWRLFSFGLVRVCGEGEGEGEEKKEEEAEEEGADGSSKPLRTSYHGTKRCKIVLRRRTEEWNLLKSSRLAKGLGCVRICFLFYFFLGGPPRESKVNSPTCRDTTALPNPTLHPQNTFDDYTKIGKGELKVYMWLHWGSNSEPSRIWGLTLVNEKS